MKKNPINETEPKQDSLVFNAFEKNDYRDAFLISFDKNTFKSINDFAKRYFMSQPAWLRLISMNTISKQKIKDNLMKYKVVTRDDCNVIGLQVGLTTSQSENHITNCSMPAAATHVFVSHSIRG